MPYSYGKKNKSNSINIPAIYAIILAFGVMLGFLVNSVTQGKKPVLGGEYNKIDEVLTYIDAKYVDTVNNSELEDKTITEMLSNLDPHTVYIPASELSEVNESLEGNFEGVGIEFYIVQDTITVVNAIPNGPSELMGIKAGDRIIKINDTIVAGVKVKDTDVKHKLRGPKGTTVKVAVLRSGNKDLIDFNIRRDNIPLLSIDAAYMLDAQTGYIKINNFAGTTHQEFVSKLQELENKGMRKLVIDLRGNPGGYLEAAINVADELIPGDSLLLFTKGKASDRMEYHAEKKGLFEKGDLCVLIDQGSASASEILSGAIQDLDRGTIIGRTSFGKGLVQEQYKLKDGSALRITIARYYTPSGRCIQRPYDKGTDAYYNEIYERYNRGEFVHEDSIVSRDTTVYHTAKGRRVYGGGGIRPDVFVPMDTSADNEYFYTVRGYVPEFVYKYSSLHSGMLDKYTDVVQFKKEFVITPELLNQFYTYAESAGLKRNKQRDPHIEAQVKQYLLAFIAKQAWRLEGFYYIANSGDKVIDAAIENMK